MESIDVIVLGGTTGSKQLRVDGKEEYKPFINLGGKHLIEYPIYAALDCPSVRHVYAVTSDYIRLNSALLKRGQDFGGRLSLTPDQGSVMANIRETVSTNVLVRSGFEIYHSELETVESYLNANHGAEDLKVLVLYADTPFITGEDISRFVATSDASADYVIGFTHDKAVNEIEIYVDRELAIPETKTALFPYSGTLVRVNNMLMGYPLRMPEEVWTLSQKVYDNRYLLKQNGDADTRNWKKIIEMFKDYAMSYTSKRPTIFKGFLRGAIHFGAFYLAHTREKKWAELMLEKEDFEKAAFEITGCRCRGSANISDVALPMFDVDNQEMLDMLRADDEALFKALRDAPRFYSGFENVLDSFVDEHADLFVHDEEIPHETWEHILEAVKKTPN